MTRTPEPHPDGETSGWSTAPGWSEVHIEDTGPSAHREHTRLERLVTKETTSGLILVAAAALALVFANSPLAGAYFGVRDTYLGFDLGSLHLRMSIGHWAADGLLAIFFFIVGLELKQEITQGALRDPRKALVPVVAAAGGVAVPAMIYALVNLAGPAGALGGWAIPAATDIAFAVALLGLFAPKLPVAVRTFLLTLAIVDDLIAILIIAIFYATDLRLGYLALALIPIALYALVARRAERLMKRRAWAAWLVLLPLGAITWALFYNSGVHATIAGVVLAFLVPTVSRTDAGHPDPLAEQFVHRFGPISSGIAVPVFAFFSAGVAVGGISGLLEAWQSSIAIGVVAGLVLGKILGILGATFLVTRIPGVGLDPSLKWADMLGMSALAGIGFTVSLLIAELSFASGDPMQDWAKVGVLTASVLAAIAGAALLAPRNRRYARLEREGASL